MPGTLLEWKAQKILVPIDEAPKMCEDNFDVPIPAELLINIAA